MGKPVLLTVEISIRNAWLEAFRGFQHGADLDFVQMLDKPPLPPMHPGYRKIRCWHFEQGVCALSSLCSYSHDLRAPISLSDGGKEDIWRARSAVPTADQKKMGQGAYITEGQGPPASRRCSFASARQMG